MPYQGFGLDQLKPPNTSQYNELTQDEQAERGAEAMVDFMNSCPGKSAISGVMGVALGAVFGLFMSSMSFDAPMSSYYGMDDPRAKQMLHIAELPFKQQVKLQFSDMGRRTVSSAKSFGFMGMVYSGVECVVQSLRSNDDLWNAVMAGFCTGAGLAFRSGPKAAFLGGAGFGAFSAAIDLYMEKDNRTPPKNDFNE